MPDLWSTGSEWLLGFRRCDQAVPQNCVTPIQPTVSVNENIADASNVAHVLAASRGVGVEEHHRLDGYNSRSQRGFIADAWSSLSLGRGGFRVLGEAGAK